MDFQKEKRMWDNLWALMLMEIWWDLKNLGLHLVLKMLADSLEKKTSVVWWGKKILEILTDLKLWVCELG